LFWLQKDIHQHQIVVGQLQGFLQSRMFRFIMQVTASEQGVVASGGRVLTVTGIGEDLTEARNRAYRAISQISLAGSFYRSDIALNASVAEKGN
jgi:phosphoribosylamine-glycine ligase